ncbi:MAG: VWA domain-containing protein, partial [Oligosphaeraceae bacterium]|nr:VWA domain-containing protein [Oligosphaeraceae bacterium]
MKLSKYIVISMALSILVHLLLLKAAATITLGHHQLSPDRPFDPKEFYIPITMFREKPRPEPPQPEEPQRQQNPSLPDLATIKRISGDLKREVKQLSGTRKVEAILRDSKLLEPPKARYRLDGVDKRRTLGPKLPEDVKPVLATAPRPEILEIDYSQLPTERQALTNRIFTPKLEREISSAALLPSLTPHGELTSAFGGAYGLTVQTGYKPTFGAPNFDVAALSRGEDGSGSGTSLLDEAPAILQGSTAEAKTAAQDLPLPFDDFVDIRVQVVRDQSGSGGYFQVDIMPNASSDTMQDIAKDTLFVIDHSTSISPQKLEQFKLAAREALNSLNPRDGFNVVSFTTSAKPLFNVFAPITDRNLNTASEYIAGLWRGGMTDVFGSLSPFVQKSNGDMNRPVNIFLLTDGQSTVNIYQAPDFLRQIVGLNPGNVSIYPFSAGRQANRQLLDFLGYLNRGSQCHVEEIEQLRPRLVEYISTHSSLVIMNLQYTAE